MKINRRLFRKSVLAAAAAAVIGLGVSCTDIWSEQHPGTYYTNNGETVADYLTGRVKQHGDYSYFISILEKAELWGQMRTYGTYTCFAPNNEAMQAYIDLRREEAPSDSVRAVFTNIETVLQNRKLCDTIARTHIFNNAMYATDLAGTGVLEHPNMLDRYMSYTCFADTIPVTDSDGKVIKGANGEDSTTVVLKYLLNQQSIITKSDDSVQNGVVHQIDKVIMSSNDFLPELMKLNPEISIWTAALFETHLRDTLRLYWDENYPEIDYEWTIQAIKDGGGHKHSTSYETDYETIPEKREFKFTVFVLTDSILAADYNIHNWEELRDFANTVYGDGTNEDLPLTDRYNPLNKLLSYHILPCDLSYDQFNTSHEDIVKNHKDKESFDIEDFFETIMPHSIMRISSAYKGDKRIGIFINRKGTEKNKDLVSEGIKICDGAKGEYKGHTTLCKNGEYHYVNKMVLYDDFTRNTVLQCRMRIMTCTLSPDFINSGARGRLRVDDRITYRFLPGFCKYWEWVDSQTEFFVRYRDASFGTFNGDEMTVMKAYDIAFKLPPVPTDGNYEIRMWNNAMKGTNVADRGVVQYYLHEATPADASVNWRAWKWDPQGIPVDLRLGGEELGWVSDNDLQNDEERIAVNDRGFRNRGYMKAMDSYGNSSGSSLRDDANCYRKIIANEYLRANMDYWVRIRQVYSGGTGVNPFSFLEIVPKSVYENNEDKH